MSRRWAVTTVSCSPALWQAQRKARTARRVMALHASRSWPWAACAARCLRFSSSLRASPRFFRQRFLLALRRRRSSSAVNCLGRPLGRFTWPAIGAMIREYTFVGVDWFVLFYGRFGDPRSRRILPAGPGPRQRGCLPRRAPASAAHRFICAARPWRSRGRTALRQPPAQRGRGCRALEVIWLHFLSSREAQRSFLPFFTSARCVASGAIAFQAREASPARSDCRRGRARSLCGAIALEGLGLPFSFRGTRAPLRARRDCHARVFFAGEARRGPRLGAVSRGSGCAQRTNRVGGDKRRPPMSAWPEPRQVFPRRRTCRRRGEPH